MATEGASNNERLLAAARSDNEEMLLEVFEQGSFDINFQDGLGNTALHYAASKGSTDVLEHILSHEDCDVDPINRIERATPLHLALRIDELELRRHIVESLLDAGANTWIRDKNGQTAIDVAPRDDLEILTMIRKARAEASLSMEDIDDEEEDEEGDEEGSGSSDEE